MDTLSGGGGGGNGVGMGVILAELFYSLLKKNIFLKESAPHHENMPI